MQRIITALLLFSLPHLSLAQADFIATFKTDNPGTSSSTSVIIPATSASGYQVDFNNDGDLLDAGEATVHNTAVTHNFGAAGTYTVRIVGNLDQITYANNVANDPEKILSVDQWGTASVWSSMADAFYGCVNLSIPATDAPDLSVCTTMIRMLRGATNFNSPVNHWNVSNIAVMTDLFRSATNFNQPLNTWDVSSITWADGMFRSASSFNQSVDAWTWTSAVNINSMFRDATSFNQPLNSWDLTNNPVISAMFRGASAFNQPLNNWDVSGITTLNSMFRGATSFNQDLSAWDVSGITNMADMFNAASSFNQPLNGWDVSAVTNISGMFRVATSFNQPVNSWVVTGISNMTNLFRQASSFDQSVNAWNVSGVSNMTSMFQGATAFDQPLNSWVVSGVTNMSSMFRDATTFNQDLSAWNVSAVTNMSNMFNGASSFDQSLGSWSIAAVTNMGTMLSSSGLSCVSYDNTLIGWEAQAVSGLTLGANSLDYDNGQSAHTSLTTTYSWTISGDVFNDGCATVGDFFATFKTDNPGTSSSTSVIIPVTSTTGYQLDFNNDGDLLDAGEATVHTTALTHDFGAAGTYTIRMVGNLDQIAYANNAANDPEKILSVDQWGNSEWTSMAEAFYGCVNLSIPATDAPDLSGCTTMIRMFRGATSFNSAVNHWNVSNITIMTELFRSATSFNQALSTWDVSNVTMADAMFQSATSFNQSIDAWTWTSAVNINSMFRTATSFNQPLNSWDLSNDPVITSLFRGATAFNQPLNNWDVSGIASLNSLFRQATSFNQDISAWNVSGVTNMANMFQQASSFNRPLNAWDVSAVSNMGNMFNAAIAFNQPLNGWVPTAATSMSGMFRSTTNFNQTLDAWDVSGVSNMSNMFNSASGFDQPLDDWNVSGATNMSNMLSNSGMSCASYDLTLYGWDQQAITGKSLDATNLSYDNAVAARASLTSTRGWTITGDIFSDGCSMALPVELLFFTADFENGKVDLHWQTASETDNDYFLVQRSPDGEHWESIAEVQGAGNSITAISYHLVDYDPLEGTSYYRLQQVDFDGTSAYSPIVAIQSIRSAAIYVYPNPTAGVLSIASPDAEEVFSYQLMDIHGKVVLSSSPTSDASAATQLNLENVEAGFYLLRVYNSYTDHTFRIIKE